MTALWNENAVQKKRIDGLARLLAERLSVWERSFAEERPIMETVATKENLIMPVRHLSVRVVELEGEVVKYYEAVEDHNVKFKAAEKQADHFKNEKDGLHARLQQSQRRQVKVDGSIIRAQGAIDCFSSGLKKDREYM